MNQVSWSSYLIWMARIPRNTRGFSIGDEGINVKIRGFDFLTQDRLPWSINLKWIGPDWKIIFIVLFLDVSTLFIFRGYRSYLVVQSCAFEVS